MYSRKIQPDLTCGIVVATKIIGGKWKPCILYAIHEGHRRPSEIQRYIAGATPRVIEMQMRELENDGLLTKLSNHGYPRRTEYDLTELGQSVIPIIHSLDIWGATHKHLYSVPN